ncbi:MAG TPA: glycosyltransferase [Verrucomicrobiae bacterium]|nr:glycosyltransferase [Verrucomicrobiae bacterium]
MTNASLPAALSLRAVKSPQKHLDGSFLRDLAQRFNLLAFVETGTYLGDSTAIAADIFNAVHSIELSPELAARARDRFRAQPNVKIYQGDSAQRLPEILSSLTGRTLFWLDGHYSSGITAKGTVNTPILDELSAIHASCGDNAVLLIDDLRMFDLPRPGSNAPDPILGYPPVKDLYRVLAEMGYQLIILGDAGLAVPQKWNCPFSPVLMAMTLSRVYDGSNLSIEEVIEAEKVIVLAQGTEKELLRTLCALYGDFESFGLGLHFRLWRGLSLLQDNNLVGASEELEKVAAAGLTHWRIKWYLALIKQQQNQPEIAMTLLDDLLAVAPDFAPAHVLRQNLAKAIPSNIQEPFATHWKQMQAEYHGVCSALDQSGANRNEEGFVHPSWRQFKSRIRTLLLGAPNKNFLDDPTLSDTMVRRGFRVSQEFELTYLQHCLSDRTRNPLSTFRDADVPLPRECKALNCSTNTLGHLFYAAKTLEQYGPAAPGLIVELGAGYGNLARIFKHFVPGSTLVLIDLPELLALQWLFLRTTVPGAQIELHHQPPFHFAPGSVNLVPTYYLQELSLSADLFISTFALSEAPSAVQAAVVDKKFFGARLTYIAGQLQGASPADNWVDHRFLHQAVRSLYSESHCQPFHVFQNGVMLYEILGKSALGEKSRERGSLEKDASASHGRHSVGSAVNGTSSRLSSGAIAAEPSTQVVVKLQGGLGNQMFQYAAGLALARRLSAQLKLDLSFLLDRSPRPNFTYRDFCLDIFQLPSGCELLRNPGAVARLPKFVEQQFNFDPRFETLNGDIYLDGYWQSARFFESIKPEIRSIFSSFAHPLTSEQQALAEQIESCQSVCLNVRRGDYVSNPVANAWHGVCQPSYFREAVAWIQKRKPDAKFFVFSDDVEWCSSADLVGNAPVTYVSHEFAGEKFGAYLNLMTRCRHFILPNSSFGWWAAFLGNASDKIVVVPEPWFDDPTNDTSDLLPEGWVRLPKQAQVAPKVSVVISSHNYASYLPQAFESVLNQSFRDFEILVIDDGSTDNTLNVAQALAARQNQQIPIRVFRLENVGPSRARAFGAKQARGRYWLPLDADDRIAPDYLARTVPILESDPSLGFAYVDTVYFGGAEKRHHQPEYDFKKLCQENFISYCSLIRKAAFDEVRGYDPENWGYYEDWDLWIRLGAKGWAGRHLGEPLFFYRCHFESSLSLYSERLGPIYRAFLIKQHPELHSAEAVAQAETILREMPAGWHSQPPMRDPETLRRLLEAHPGNRHVTFFLALALFRAGRLRDANNVVHELLSYAPNDQHSQKLLANLSTTAPDAPLVSVIVPTYNRPEQLKQALQSILNQTFQDFEIVVVNDAGSDIGSVVTPLNQQGNIVALRHETNRGLAAARNTGIRAARGRYIAYLDDDDLFYPNHLETLVEFLRAHPATVAYTDANQALQQLENGSWTVTERKVVYSNDWNNDEVLVRNLAPVICFMHEKQALEKSGWFDETLDRHEDWDLWIRLSRQLPFIHLPEVTCEFSFRNDGSSMTGQGAARFLSTMERIHARYESMVQNRPDLLYAQWLAREGLFTTGQSSAADGSSSPRVSGAPVSQFLPPQADFDEERYLDQNPDVAEAVRQGSLKSGWSHFRQSGVCEKRRWFHRSATPSIPGRAQRSRRECRAVSIVIPVFNRLDMTQRCLRSIQTHSAEVDYEVIVVDNCSTDGTAEWVRQFGRDCDRVRLIQNPKNLGFARASNQGAEAARGRYVIFLNNDTEVLSGWLPPMISVVQQDPSVGAVGCKLLFPDRTIQHAGVVISVQAATGHIGPFHIYYKQPSDLPDANQLREYNVCTGACLLLPKALIEELNGFDEEFWNGYEDVDLCLRVREKGLRVVYQPATVVVHYESQSGAERFSKEQRNIDLLQKKWRQKVAPDVIVAPDGKARLQPTTGIRPYQARPAMSQTAPGLQGGAMPLVTIVIPTFNNLPLTKQCLASIYQDSSWNALEIVIVDNGSTDGTRVFLGNEEQAGRLRAILNETNKGFAHACNQGARAARGKYVIFLNNDTEVRPGWLQPLVGTAEADNAVGAVGAKLLFPDNTIQHAGVVLLDDRKLGDPLLARHVFERAAHDHPGANRPMCYQALTGACLLVPAKLFQDLGGFDEGYWNGYEDVDLCLRIAKAGRLCVYQPACVVLHRESQSGPERFRKTRENVARLHQKWLGQVNVDFIAGLEGAFVKTPNDAIRPYSYPLQTPAAACQVSIVIPVLNQLEHTRKCLESIAASTPLPHEIIVVDNGSTDTTPEFLNQWKASHPNLTVIRNSRNVGFAAANNQAFSIARGANVLLLNNDTIVAPGWLEGLLRVLDRYPEVGIVGPVSNNVSGPQMAAGVDYPGITHLPVFAAAWANTHRDESFETPRAVGFCLLLRRAVLERIGGLDESFGSGNFEDDDFCIRARIAGFRVRIAKDVFIHHTGSQTFKGSRINYREAMHRNWDIFRTKWKLPAEVTLGNGYPVPNRLPDGVDLKIEVPPLEITHESDGAGCWREKVSKPAAPAKRPTPPVALVGNLEEARAQFAQKQWAASWTSATTAVLARPYHPEAYLLLAEIAAAAGDGQTARSCAHQAKAMAPDWRAPRQFLQKSLKGKARPEWLQKPDWVLQPPGTAQHPPRITICLIARNEEKFLAQCLQSIKDIAFQIVVVDTGSTDRTAEIAKSFGAEVYSFAWCDDFSAARNAALEHARGDWVLVLDADEELPPAQHARLRADLKNSKSIGFRLPLINRCQEAEGCSCVPRLFRNAPGVYYYGRIHEQVFPSIVEIGKEWGLGTAVGTAELLHHGYLQEIVSERNKIERNLNLLRKAVEECPGDANLEMNLGLEWTRSGDLDKGLVHYRRAFQIMSADARTGSAPELREALLTQFTSHLYKRRAHDEIVSVLTSPLAKAGGLSASLHFALGLASFELQKYEQAAEQMRQCLAKRRQQALSPINTDILTAAPAHCLAMSLAKSGDFAAAEKMFQAGMKETGRVEDLMLDYARFLEERNRPVEAFNLLHQWVTQNSACVKAWRIGGRIALSRPDFLEFACDWTAEAIRHLPKDAEIMAQRAEALLLTRHIAQAAELWQAVAKETLQPRAEAAWLICELVQDRPLGSFEPEQQFGSISREFIAWYQRCLVMGGQEIVGCLNGRINALRCVLPAAADMLEAALSEAEKQPVNAEACMA